MSEVFPNFAGTYWCNWLKQCSGKLCDLVCWWSRDTRCITL